MAFAKRISAWGVAGLVLSFGEIALGEYNLYMYDHGRRQVMSSAAINGLGVVVQLAAVMCGIVAMRRGSKWWALAIVLALMMAVMCYVIIDCAIKCKKDPCR